MIAYQWKGSSCVSDYKHGSERRCAVRPVAVIYIAQNRQQDDKKGEPEEAACDDGHYPRHFATSVSTHSRPPSHTTTLTEEHLPLV